jgi:peptidoglycan/LPS O-acetylase OafA/YrhL
MTTIQQLDSGRNNNFDFLRFFAASIVIFSHCFFLTGNNSTEPLYRLCGIVSFGTLGVKIFFSISGYLIIKSLYRQHTLNSFVLARVLRIFPGLFVTAMFCAFIIGPVCTVLSLHNYFYNSEVYNFLWRQATLQAYPNTLPGVFLTNPVAGNVNSPLWTLPGELFMYISVLLWGVILLFRKVQLKAFRVIPLLLIVFAFWWGVEDASAYLVNLSNWGVLFLSGALAYFFRDKITLSFPLFAMLTVLLLILFHYRFKFIMPVIDLVLVYGILIFAFHPGLQVKNFHKFGDFSYGLYIYALPIQQLIVSKFPLITPWQLFFCAWPLALGMAMLSWYFIEKPMLKLKDVRLSPKNNFHIASRFV